jgi:transposase
LEHDPTRMCELLVGLPDVNVEGVGDWPRWLRIVISTRADRPRCPSCAGAAWRHDDVDVELVDLPCFERRTRLVWSKQRWRCPKRTCDVVTFVEVDERIAANRAGITDQAGRWATFQVGHHRRAVSEVDADLGCDWHTVMDAVNHHGLRLIEDPNRIRATTAVGLDEVLFCRDGPFKHRLWSTQVVDVARGQLLDVVPGRDAASCCRWFAEQPVEWMAKIRWATLDLSGSYRSVFDRMLPHAVQIADPFLVVKLANFVLDEVRRRVQNDTLGHRGRKTDPLYRCRKLMTLAHERLDDTANAKLVVCSRLETLTARSAPRGTRRNWCGRSMRSRTRSWLAGSSRSSFGIANWTNYRTRSLLYAGRPDWSPLDLNSR